MMVKQLGTGLEQKIVTSMCGVCPAGCGVNVHLLDGKIERISPLKNHPQGCVCPRGMAAKEIVYSPDRLLYPQKRVGKRGEGKFERISWEQAYDFVAQALQVIAREYGPEAASIYTGRGNFEYGLNEAFAPSGTTESSANAVLFPFGSPNTTGVGSLCYVSYGMVAGRACFGEDMRNMREDVDHAELILVWGENPATDSPPLMLPRLKSAQRRGAQVVVIDHRFSETAKALNCEWIGIRPGTDGALALGMANVLINEQRYDRAFAAEWMHGFPEFSEYAQAFTPERVSQITHVPIERIRSLARAVGIAKGCSILTYTGLEYSNTGTQAIRAVWILQALAGHLDVPGGKLFKMPERLQLNRLLTDPPRSVRKPVGSEEYPLYYEVRHEAHAIALPKAILEDDPYPIRGLIVGGASILTAWPDPELWRRALATLDLLVIVNRFPTADAQYADILLPATTLFENKSYMFYDGYVQLRQQVIPPLGEARNDYLIYAQLACHLGYGHLWPQTEEALLEQVFRDTGIDLDELKRHPEGLPYPEPELRYRKYLSGGLRQDGQPGFNTPTGKFEIASEWLGSHGYDRLPCYVEPVEGPIHDPELNQVFPLVFNSGARTQSTFRSQHLNIPSLISRQPWPLVYLHTQDAVARGIHDGDDVVVVTPRGQAPFRARVTHGILPGVVEVNMGGGGPIGPVAWQSANVNCLTDFYNRDPILGFPVYKALLCDVRKEQP
jgi:anaerobic selenocysteine-containing dehydrogenase